MHIYLIMMYDIICASIIPNSFYINVEKETSGSLVTRLACARRKVKLRVKSRTTTTTVARARGERRERGEGEGEGEKARAARR